MKKKYKTANLNFFHYFERKLLEDYLNDMAKVGYHLKFGNISHKFEYKPDQHVYYHVDTVKTKKRYMGQVKPDEQYLDLFESQGYHFLGQWNYFHVFVSAHKESIFSDVNEEDIGKDVKKKENKSLMSSLILDFFLVAFFLIIILSGGPNYTTVEWLSDCRLFYGFALMLQLIGRVYGNYIPLIGFKITRSVNYTYLNIFQRQYCVSVLAVLSLFVLAASLLCVNVKIVTLTVIVALLCMFFVFKRVEDTDILQSAANIFLDILLAVLIIFNNYGNAYELQHSAIKYKDYSQRSSLMEWSWYQLNDSEDMLSFIDVYEPLLTDYVFDSFIGENEYIQDGDTYFVRDYVVVRKENRILKMEKDFYENHLSSLEW